MLSLPTHEFITGAKALRRFIADKSGATAIEYALLAALLALAVVSAAHALGPHVAAAMDRVGAALVGDGDGGTPPRRRGR